MVIIHVRVVNNRGAVKYRYPIPVGCTIAIPPVAINMALGYKYPVVVWNTDVYVDAHTGAKRSPPVVAAATTPAHPRRSPIISGYPSPPIIVAICPAAIVERSPSPRIIRNPGIAVGSHYPMAVGGIRLEIRSRIREPDISIFRIIYPIPMRCKVIIE